MYGEDYIIKGLLCYGTVNVRKQLLLDGLRYSIYYVYIWSLLRQTILVCYYQARDRHTGTAAMVG